MTKISILACLSIAASVLVGCGASDSGGTPEAGTTPDTGATLYGLSGGDNCYTITAIAAGYSDGCGLTVETQVGQSLPLNYSADTYFVKLGTDGALGGGAIAYNQGTLIRENDPSISTTCTIHQKDTSVLQMLANNQFTVSVTEVESNFGAACGTLAPAGGTCTSTWTWTMEKSNVATLIPPLCGATP